MTEPLYLTRLQLQQFRSFSDLDVKLDAAPGVLIVQGTNGLGKSSLFHGLEWVLTDQIAEFRLVDAQKTAAAYLCRWTKPAQVATSVAMEFSDGQTLRRELANPKSKQSRYSGPSDVAGWLKTEGWGSEIEDLSHYLLLTHFLSQSNLPRIPHRNPKDRFDILKDAAQSREPERLGRALHGANTTKPARAFKGLIENLKADAETLGALLDQEATAWSDAQMAGALDPVATLALGEEIAASLRAAKGRTGPLEDSTDVSAAALTVELNALTLAADRDALALARSREIAAEHGRVAVSLAEAEEGLKSCDARIAVLPAEEARARAGVNEHRERLTRATDAASDRQARVASLDSLAATESALASLKAGDADRPDPADLDLRVESAEAQIAALRRRDHMVQALKTGLAMLTRDRDEVVIRRLLIEELEASDGRLAAHTAALDAIERANQDLFTQLQTAQGIVQSARESVGVLFTTMSALAQATEAIAGAVSTIVAHLPPDACACPVCDSRFTSPQALRERAQAAADRLAPELSSQRAQLAEADLRHEGAVARRDELQDLADQIEALRLALESERTSRAALLRRASDLGLTDLADLGRLQGTLIQTLDQLTRRQERTRRWLKSLDLGSEMTSRLQNATRARDAEVRNRDLFARARADSLTRQNWLASEIERVTLDLFGPAALASADRAIAAQAIRDAATAALAERDYRQAELAQAGQALALLTEEMAALTARRNGLAAQRSELQRQAVALREEWSALGMTGSVAALPDAMLAISDREAQNLQVRDLVAQASARLQTLRDGRLAWSRQGAHRNALDRLRKYLKTAANHTREQIRETGEAKVKALNARALIAGRTKAIAAEASTKIDEALNEFNADYIRPLADLMNRINRSILCDPRIGIDFTVDRNAVGQSAVVGDQIPKDRGPVDPRLVHSEGQMAALGVSLLSAASLTFGWSRWKALVLDDPLQHNDAIHASAFADFVGNLVRAQGYQILMSTHELAQAEFLRRKFRARGIPCTMVTLLGAGRDGVEESIDGPRTAGAGSA